MPMYTVMVHVEVFAEHTNEAHSFIRHALDNAKKAEIVILDSEVTDQRPDESEDERETTPRRLTRHEQLQEMADRGCDTWEEYRGER